MNSREQVEVLFPVPLLPVAWAVSCQVSNIEYVDEDLLSGLRAQPCSFAHIFRSENKLIPAIDRPSLVLSGLEFSGIQPGKPAVS